MPVNTGVDSFLEDVIPNLQQLKYRKKRSRVKTAKRN